MDNGFCVSNAGYLEGSTLWVQLINCVSSFLSRAWIEWWNRFTRKDALSLHPIFIPHRFLQENLDSVIDFENLGQKLCFVVIFFSNKIPLLKEVISKKVKTHRKRHSAINFNVCLSWEIHLKAWFVCFCRLQHEYVEFSREHWPAEQPTALQVRGGRRRWCGQDKHDRQIRPGRLLWWVHANRLRQFYK